jgi:hypothetical protein
MTFAERFRSSRRVGVFVAGLSFCFWFSPKALKLWERSLVSAAVRACEVEGGLALIATDNVVSCAPRARVKELP